MSPNCDKKSALLTDCKRRKAGLSLAPSSLMGLVAAVLTGQALSIPLWREPAQWGTYFKSVPGKLFLFPEIKNVMVEKKKGSDLVFPSTNRF